MAPGYRCRRGSAHPAVAADGCMVVSGVLLPLLISRSSSPQWLIAICAPLGVGSSPAIGQTQSGAAILVYHRFGPIAGSTTVSDAALDQQLGWLHSHAHVVPLRSVIEAVRAEATAGDRPCVAVTADDGHRSIYTDLYPRILRYRLRITLFIYPSAISNASYALTWSQLTEMAGSGLVDVQSHTYWHPDFRQEKAHRTAADYRSLSMCSSCIPSKCSRPISAGRWICWLGRSPSMTRNSNQPRARTGYSFGFLLGNRPACPALTCSRCLASGCPTAIGRLASPPCWHLPHALSTRKPDDLRCLFIALSACLLQHRSVTLSREGSSMQPLGSA